MLSIWWIRNKVWPDLCRSFYGEVITVLDIVPITSFSSYRCRVQTKAFAALEARHPNSRKVIGHELVALEERPSLAAMMALAEKVRKPMSSFTIIA